jgi:radical SAM superfamily enzyme YgiQ (UPF0313 family)
MRCFPSLDFVLVGEPELTLRDLVDALEQRANERSEGIERLFARHDPTYKAKSISFESTDLSNMKGLGWRYQGEIIVNEPRPFIADLDDLPMPRHDLLPLQSYCMPMLKGPFTFIVPSRGCPAACSYCIKHVTYQNTVRVRSAKNVLSELWYLKKLGLDNVHMYADLFTVDREHVVSICEQMIHEQISMKWTCNSRVDFVDEELLRLMARAGCHLIAWGIESGSVEVLKNVRKGANPAKARLALGWAKDAGIKNWGYFIIGLPGETESTIRQTIDLAKALPLDIALFHVASPYPGTPFFFEAVRNRWFEPSTTWEKIDMDEKTVINYPRLSEAKIEYWQKRAFREWAFRPGPFMTFVKMVFTDLSMLKRAADTMLRHISWLARSR